MKKFVHLHLHTQYSLLDGAIKIGPLVRRVKELDMDSVAVTDHGVMMGVVEFYEKARKEKIRPILGVEAYVASGSMLDKGADGTGTRDASHLVLLAEDERGYRNLLELVSLAHRDGFYYKPRVDHDLLRRLSAGIIATSACLKGEIPQALVAGDLAGARALAEEYRDIFGAGNFFLEVQDNGLPAQKALNDAVAKLARETGIGLVATADCHYLAREDAKAHEILLCLQTGKKMSDPDRMNYGTDQLYVKSPAEMEAAFRATLPEAIDNTRLIADRCKVDLTLGKFFIPDYPTPGEETPSAHLRRLAAQGLDRRLEEKAARGEPLPDDGRAGYLARLDYELAMIDRMGFPGYFLIVYDFIRFAKERGIAVGPGRGSAAGSLVSYAVGITELDPIQHGLLFERFLNPDRISLPDVDVDFCKARREEVIDYVKEKYGHDRVLQIITFGTMKARAVIRDVGRVLELPYADVDRIAKMVPEDPKMTLDRAFKAEPRLAEAEKADPRIADLFRHARALEGLSRHASTHAAGVVISNRPIVEYTPLYRNASTNDITTQFDMQYVEKIGLVKFDFLGLRTLTALQNAAKLVEARTGKAVNLNAVPLDDAATYDMLAAGDTDGVFQAEGGGFTKLLVRMRPEKFDHLVDMVALYRPGPLQSGMVDDFIEGRHGRKTASYALPQLEPILRSTYGVILYQEQVMQIAVAVSGFTLAQADTLRKAMGKKIAALMEEQRAKFIDGATGRGVDRKAAEDLFTLIAQFAEYGFNKSHSAAYALIAYWTAWMKRHHPLEYMSALLTSEAGDTDKVIRYIAHCRRHSVPVLPPDVNESGVDFLPTAGGIRFGLSAVKGVGEAAVEAIAAARADSPFASVGDFLSRVDLRRVNKRVLEALVKAGAFDSLSPSRANLHDAIPDLLARAQKDAKAKANGAADAQVALFDIPKEKRPEDEPGARLGDRPEWTGKERLGHEKDTIGFYVSGHPLDDFKREIELFGDATTLTLQEPDAKGVVRICGTVAEVRERPTRTGARMANVVLEDLHGTVNAVVFPQPYAASKDVLAAGEPVVLEGTVERDEAGHKILAESITLLKDARYAMAKGCILRMNSKRHDAEEAANDVADLKAILSSERHRGQAEVHLVLRTADGREAVVSLPKVKVRPSPELREDLAKRFGYEILWFQ